MGSVLTAGPGSPLTPGNPLGPFDPCMHGALAHISHTKRYMYHAATCTSIPGGL